MNDAKSPPRGRLFVVSGPSGVGKDTILDRFELAMPDVLRVVTATTRTPRDGERHGQHYLFYPAAEFSRLVERGAFLEHALVNGNLYGTPRFWVEEHLAQGKDVLLKIDVQGGKTVKSAMPEAVLVFLLPPSVEELERRLRGRGTESEEQIALRLRDARAELRAASLYDYAVVNDEIERAVETIRAIVIAERCRVAGKRDG